MMYTKIKIVSGTLALLHNLAIDLANFFVTVADDLDGLVDKVEEYGF